MRRRARRLKDRVPTPPDPGAAAPRRRHPDPTPTGASSVVPMNLLRRFARVSGLAAARSWLRRFPHTAPDAFANWVFQRLVGVNRSCPWPVHFTSKVMHPARIHIHPSVRDSFAASGGCYIQGTNGIHLGEGTIFAPGVKIISANHDPETLACAQAAAPIRIGAHCWLGANAVVLPGVQLGDHVVVGAGSVVTRSFPSGAIIAGVPARLIRLRTPAAAAAAATVQPSTAPVGP